VSTYEEARAAWGFPRFAKDFPREDELDRLVVAYTHGDYGTVRERAPKLAKSTEDDAVKAAAERLLAATVPDPTSKVLFLVTAALLAFLTIYWMTHDHAAPGHDAPAPPPTVEYPNGKR
jgi:hypothetical protein